MKRNKKTCKRWTPLPVVMYTLMIYVTYTCIDRREYSFTIAFGKTTIFLFLLITFTHPLMEKYEKIQASHNAIILRNLK